MASIITKDEKAFCCKTPTYRTIPCFIKDGKMVEVEFNHLFISGAGDVKARIKGTDKYASLRQITPQKESDGAYIDFMEKELKSISKKYREQKAKYRRTHERVEIIDEASVAPIC